MSNARRNCWPRPDIATAAGNYDRRADSPSSDVEILYNTLESNRQVAEFVQAQWKQNLGITVPLRNMEFRTYLGATLASCEYKGFARSGWIGDYMDPYTFLSCLAALPRGNNGTGWWDPEYVRMLDEANRTLDPQKRYELLAKAEAYMLEVQPVIPLTDACDRLDEETVREGHVSESGHAARLEVRLHRARSGEVGLRRAGHDRIAEQQSLHMLRFVIRRLLVTIPMVLVVVTLTWG